MKESREAPNNLLAAHWDAEPGEEGLGWVGGSRKCKERGERYRIPTSSNGAVCAYTWEEVAGQL